MRRFRLEVEWKENYCSGHPPASLDTEEKIKTLLGKTFRSLDEIAQEIDRWGWTRKDPKEWPGFNKYHWEHDVRDGDTLFFPDERTTKIDDFPYLKKWPIVYHNLHHGSYYDLAQIVILDL